MENWKYKLKKYLIYFFLFVQLIMLFTGKVTATEQNNLSTEENNFSQEDLMLNQLEQIDLEKLQEEIQKINQASNNIFPEIKIKKILFNLAGGNLELNWRDIFKNIVFYIGREVVSNLHVLGQVVILAIISAVLKIFHDSFNSETISNSANLLIFLSLSILLLKSFHEAVQVGVDALNNMVSFMNAILPVLITLLISLGAMTSAAIFHPVTFLIISSIATAIKNIILPMIFISFVLTIVNNISDEFNISRLAALFKEYSIGLLTISLSIIIGGMVVQGGFAAISDSITLRTAKFLSGRIIPVVGGFFSSALGLIVNCSLLIKNSLNLIGVIAIVAISVYPLIQLLAMILIYKMAAALLQPICEERLVNIFNTMSNNLILIFAVVLGVAVMFFIVITIVVATANVTVMMR
ncbi:MAG: stage III sporulation protein AE [bacterium]